MAGASLIQADNPHAPAAGVVIDSREVIPGSIYIPMIGARADGHSFIDQVRKAGAAVSFWQKDHTPYPEGIPLLLVDDTLSSMQKLAASYLAQVDPLTIGITGSNGKTSTKDMTAAILAEKFRTVKTQGNHNNEIGLPLTIFDLEDDTEAAILEMGMENYGEIDALCEIAPLDAAIIVSIGSAHMENFGNKTNIARAKCEIIDGLPEGGLLVYDKDSPEIDAVLPEFTGSHPVEALSFSASGNRQADLYIEGDLSYSRDGLEMHVSGDDEPFLVPAAGRVQASNALGAILLARKLGLSEEQIRQGLAKTELTKMRSALIPAGKATILDDSYKSNPESSAAAVDTLMEIPAATHIAVLAGMLDLGDNEKQLHEQAGAYAKDKGVDLLFTYEKLGEDIAEGFGSEARRFMDKEELIEALRPWLEEDAAILVKGSRFFKMDEVVRALTSKGNEDE